MKIFLSRDHRKIFETTVAQARVATDAGAAKTGVASLIALCCALLRKSVRGGLVVVGEVKLGGTIEPIHNAVSLAGIAVEKGATSLLLPVSCRRQLFELSDDMATRLDVEFYQDAKDAVFKALADCVRDRAMKVGAIAVDTSEIVIRHDH